MDIAAGLAHPAAKKALAEIWGAEDKPHALVERPGENAQPEAA